MGEKERTERRLKYYSDCTFKKIQNNLKWDGWLHKKYVTKVDKTITIEEWFNDILGLKEEFKSWDLLTHEQLLEMHDRACHEWRGIEC